MRWSFLGLCLLPLGLMSCLTMVDDPEQAFESEAKDSSSSSRERNAFSQISRTSSGQTWNFSSWNMSSSVQWRLSSSSNGGGYSFSWSSSSFTGVSYGYSSSSSLRLSSSSRPYSVWNPSSSSFSSSSIAVFIEQRKWDMGAIDSLGSFPVQQSSYSVILPINDQYYGGKSAIKKSGEIELANCLSQLTVCVSQWSAKSAQMGATLVANLHVDGNIFTASNQKKMLPQAGWWILNLFSSPSGLTSIEDPQRVVELSGKSLGLSNQDVLRFQLFVPSGQDVFFELIGSKSSGYDLAVPRYRYRGTGRWETVQVQVKQFIIQYQPYTVPSQLVLDPSQVVGLAVVYRGGGDPTTIFLRDVTWLKQI